MCDIPTAPHPTDAGHSLQQTTARHMLVQGDQRFLEATGMAVCYDEADIIYDGSNVADVITNPL